MSTGELISPLACVALNPLIHLCICSLSLRLVVSALYTTESSDEALNLSLPESIIPITNPLIGPL